MKKKLIKIYLKLWWEKHKFHTLAAMVVIAVFVLVFTFPRKEYFYIDYEGNKGVAAECGKSDVGLWCNREFGGKIMVQEYWQED